MRTIMAHLQVLVLLLPVLFTGTLSQSDIRIPPNIYQPSSVYAMKVYYNEHSTVNFTCVADGSPSPTFRWTRNDITIISDQYVMFDSRTGNLTIPDFTKREEATYRCIVSNVMDNGMGGQITPQSWSSPIKMYLSDVTSSGDASTIKTIPATEYGYLKLPCEISNAAGLSVKYNWYNEKGASITIDDTRQFIDSAGNLHFTYVLKRDETTSNAHYKCGVSTEGGKLILLGTKYTVSVTSQSTTTAVKPQIQYRNDGVKGMLYSSVKLECMFSGYDPAQPNNPVAIEWFDDASHPIIASAKYSFSGGGRALTINDTRESDEKVYNCKGKNAAGETPATVFLNVTSGPIFVNGVPSPQTVIEDSDVQFNCDARSASSESPPSAPAWTINGNSGIIANDPRKYELLDSGRILSIKGVKKMTDIMCVQCATSNDIDTAFANACLNVIMPIKFMTKPDQVQNINKGDSVDLTITAQTDPSQKLSYKWVFDNITYEGDTHPPNMFYNPSTNLAYINTSILTDEQFRSIFGQYCRVVYHLFESQTYCVDVVNAAASEAGAGFDLWIIGLIIALILLIVIILIIVFIICRKKQEGDYNVDKKETGAGLDPEKELKEKDFNAFSRPEYNIDYDFPDSKPPGGDPEFDDTIINDDESLGEYGKEDITYFNEDGSFIGIYQSKNLPPPQPAESTI